MRRLLCTLFLATTCHAAGYIQWQNVGTTLPAGVTELAAGGSPAVVLAVVEGGALLRSADLGANWTRLDRGAYTVAVAPTDGRLLLASAPEAGLWRSTDGGAHWTQVAAAAVEGLAFAPDEPTLVLAGARSGRQLLVSHDAGATWGESALPKELKAQYPLALDARRWVVGSRAVDGCYATADAGATWTAATGSSDHFPGALPLVAAGDRLLSSKHHGFSRSTDGGLTWTYTMEQHTRMLGAAGTLVFRENRQAVRGTDDRSLTVELSDNFGQSWEDVSGGLAAVIAPAQRGLLRISNAVDPFLHVRVATAWAASPDGQYVWLGLGRAGLVRGRLLWTRGGPLLLAASVTPLSVSEGESGVALTIKGVATTRRGSVKRVWADLSGLGGALLPLFDDGKHDDGEAGDKTYAGRWELPAPLPAGSRVLGVIAEDDAGRLSSRAVPLTIAANDERLTVWDGERYAGGLSWVAPAVPLNFIRAQSDEAHSGKVALEFHAEGSGYLGGGWNWHGWWPPESGEDIRGLRNLCFWAKLVADDPQDINVLLGSNNKETTGAVSVFEYCPELRDGEWHEVVIPLHDLYAVKRTNFDPRKAWELQFQSWSPRARSFSLLLDDLGFDNRRARRHTEWVTLPVPREPAPLGPRAIEVTASVDTAAPGTPVSPYIYGASMGDRQAAKEAGLTILRAGGNPISPFNWRRGFGSKGADWFFQNDGQGSAPEDTWLARFHGENRAAGLDTYFSLPLMGRVAKDNSSVAFDTAKYPDQESWAGLAQPTDPHPHAGNGRQWAKDAAGKRFLRDVVPNPDDTSVPLSIEEQTEFLRFLIDKCGYQTANAGGIRYVALDNEPMLWQSTHRGMRPEPLGYDEFLSRSLEAASRLKAIDPAVKVAGPTAWGWTEYFYSGLDRTLIEQGKGTWDAPPDFVAHGKVPLAKYYLTKFREQEQATGRRLLDVLDFHFYPQNGLYMAGAAGDPRTMEARVQETRVLWDPTWRDPSWMGKETGQVIALIPLMQRWIAECYPGTRTALGEYNFGGEQDVSGGVAQTELLGIFARERLDHAYLWLFPTPNSPQWFAYKLWRNPDGRHTAVGDHYLPTRVSAPDDVSVHALRDAANARLSLVLVNKRAAQPARVTLDLGRALARQTATIYEYSAADRFALGQWPARTVEGRSLSLDLPAMAALRVDLKL